MTAPATHPAAGTRTLVDFAYADLQQELAGIRRHLERVPDDQLDWRPHAKSKSLGELATHLATSLGLSLMIASREELDLAALHESPKSLASRDAIVAAFDEGVATLQGAMGALDDAALERPWTLRAGDHVLMTVPKGQVLRTLGINHLIHHRAQLGVYLRLCGAPVPGVYGPSADE